MLSKDKMAALSPQKRKLLELMLKERQAGKPKPGDHAAARCIPRRSDPHQPSVLSFGQQRLWFLQQLEPGKATYNQPFNNLLIGPLDRAVLERTLDMVIARHEILRTSFIDDGQQILQKVHPHQTVTLPYYDLTHEDPSTRQQSLARLTEETALAPFDFMTGKPWRAILVKEAHHRHVLLMTIHHMAVDGRSVDVLIREISQAYTAIVEGRQPELPELSLQYADFSQWQRQTLDGPRREQLLNFWQKQLGDAPPVLEMPFDHVRPKQLTYAGKLHPFSLDAHLTARLKRLAQERGVTLFMTLLTSFNVLLYRYTGSPDFCVGTPTTGRHRKELNNLIGMFINNLVLRAQIDDKQTFSDLLDQVKLTCLDAFDHEDLPFELLVEALRPERNMSYTPLFQNMFILANTQVAGGAIPTLKDVSIEPLTCDKHSAMFDLTLMCYDTGATLENSFEFSTDLYEDATIERLTTHYRRLLAQITHAPDTPIAQLSLMDDAERHTLLKTWNQTGNPNLPGPTVHHLFERQAALRPDAPALSFQGCDAKPLTYADLKRAVDHMADQLSAAGVLPGDLVGVFMARGRHLLPALLGIMRVGAAYVPMDPNYPEERLTYMLEHSGASLLLSHDPLARRCRDWGVTVINADHLNPLPEMRAPRPTVDNPAAYVIYTSGSTGKPKGIVIHHQSVCNLLGSVAVNPGFTADDTLPAVTSICFDISVLELFLPLTQGGHLVLADAAVTADGFQLARAITDCQATVMQATPSGWQMLLETGWNNPTDLRIWTGGEALPPRLAQTLRTRGPVFNLYGPTETTIWSSVEAIQIDAPVGLGRPLANTQIYILDTHLRPTPTGVPGELCIGGAGLAAGYHKQPAGTADRFVPDPFSGTAGARIYRTGDLARHQPDGRLSYLGRLDFQVKLRGFRIELGEIEAQLEALPQVQTAVVVLQEQPSPRLIAWLRFHAGQTCLSEAGSLLAGKLPAYMIPSVFQEMQAPPLTPNGKIDRKALARKTVIVNQGEPQEPATPTEQQVHTIWCDVLQIKMIGTRANFFEVGGHSLSATRVIARIAQARNCDLPVRLLFEHPTIADLAAALDHTADEPQRPPLTTVERNRLLPMSYAEQRLWLMQESLEDTRAYHVSARLNLIGPLHVAAWEAAFNDLTARNEILRTTYDLQNRTPYRRIAPYRPQALDLIDLGNLDAQAAMALEAHLAVSHQNIPFNLAQGPLLRVALLRRSDTCHTLLISMHHIITDAWSIDLMLAESAAAYKARLTGQPAAPQTQALQYADYAAWQRNWLQGDAYQAELGFWTNMLKDAPLIQPLPGLSQRPAEVSAASERVPFELGPDLSKRLQALAQSRKASLFAVLLTGFNILLHCRTGEEDVVLGTDVANRNNLEQERMLGFFVNQLVLRTNLHGNPTVQQLIDRTQTSTRAALGRQDMPFDKLVEALRPPRQEGLSPIFQRKFVLHNIPNQNLDAPGLTVNAIAADRDTTKLDMQIDMWQDNKGITGGLRYKTDLFGTAAMRHFVQHFTLILGHMVEAEDTPLHEFPVFLAQSDKQQRQNRRGMKKGFKKPVKKIFTKAGSP